MTTNYPPSAPEPRRPGEWVAYAFFLVAALGVAAALIWL